MLVFKNKMKTLGVLFLIIFSVSGYMIKVLDVPVSRPTLAPSGWVHLQKLVLPLFENVCENSKDPMIVRLSEEFAQNVIPSEFWDPEVMTNFQNLKTGKGMLAKGEIFSEYNPEHVLELKTVFDVLYNAKNFDTFLKAAAWARQNLNCGLYVDAIYLAFEKRRDTEKLYLPPPYELLPNYFIRKDIIIQGSSLLAGEEITPSEGVRDEGNAYTLDANYTADFFDSDDESKLAYFREDVGFNSFYFLKMLNNAPWFKKNVNLNSNYGENMYFMMKQFLSRYNMERYSHDMPEEEGIDWDALPTTPYDPMLVYSNGNEFINRSPNSAIGESEEKTLIQTIENNIATVVTHMRESGYNKTQILNHLMEILVTNDRSYDTLARRLLGKFLNNNGNPSVLEHYMTSIRDPLFWKLNKKIVDLVDNALKVLPPYTKSELYFPGVEVVSVDAKKIMTNFDYYQFDISDALKIGNGDTPFQVKIGQQRLNHKQFTIKVNISSLVSQKGMVKIYLGPKVMPGEFAQKKNQFALLDSFEINLKKGSNIVSRSSDDMKQYSLDFMSLRTLTKKVADAEFGLESLPLSSMEQQIGYPSRLSIPKGTPTGLPLQLLVFVAPYVKANLVGKYSTVSMEFNNAVLSKLYPFDLPLEDNTILDLPNILMKEISVTHKGMSSIGGSGNSKQWTGYNKKEASSKPGPNFYRPTDYNTGYENFYAVDQSNEYYSMPQKESSFQGRPSGPKYDYSTKWKQPENKEYKTQNEIDSNVNKQPTVNKEFQRQDQISEPVAEKNDNTKVLKESTDSDEHFKMQGDDASASRPRQFASSFDYSSKKKEYDYKASRPQYKKDYKNIFKNRPTTTETPEEIDQTKENIIDDVSVPKSENDLVVEDMNNIDKFDILKNNKKEKENTEGVISIVKNVPMHKFTIYDYIVNPKGFSESPKGDSENGNDDSDI